MTAREFIVVAGAVTIAAAGLSACISDGPGPMASAQQDRFHGVMKPCNPNNPSDKRVCFDVIHD